MLILGELRRRELFTKSFVFVRGIRFWRDLLHVLIPRGLSDDLDLHGGHRLLSLQ